MKKTLLLQLSAILMLSGCSSQENSTSVENADVQNETQIISEDNIVSETQKNNTDNIIKSDLNAEINNDELSEKIGNMCLEFLDDYHTGTIEADFDKCFGHFPDFYMDMLEKEVRICNETHEEYIKGVQFDYTNTYGSDLKITSRIKTDSSGTKGILKVSDESLADMKEIFKESYDRDVNLEEAYTIYITTETTGSSDTYNEDTEWFILKIDGEYYLYENYYEKYMIEE